MHEASLINGFSYTADYERYQKSVENALNPYTQLCGTRNGMFCGEYLVKQTELLMPMYLKSIELSSIIRERPYVPNFSKLYDDQLEFEKYYSSKMEKASLDIAKIGCSFKNEESCKKIALLK